MKTVNFKLPVYMGKKTPNPLERQIPHAGVMDHWYNPT